MSDESTTPSPAPAKPPRKRRGWFFKLFVFVVIVLVLLTAGLFGVQYALQNTDYARNIALPIVERQLGLRLHAGGLKVSLLGETVLTDVNVGLPFDEADFLHVPTIRVKHANLLQIILDRNVTLHDVTIDKPTVDVVQDKDGNWNLLRVADILGRLGGSNNAQPTAGSGGIPQLPAVHLVDGTIKIDDGHGHHAEVAPLNVNGRPQEQLVWTYDLSAGPAGAELLTVKGRVAPGGDWVHQVALTVGHLDPLAKAFGVPTTYAANVAAHWDGKLTDGKVGGRLKLDSMTAVNVPATGDVAVTGAVDVTTGGSGTPAAASPAGPAPVAAAAGPDPLVTISPTNLQIVTTKAAVPTLGVVAGNLMYDAAGLHARGLKVNALGGAASVDLAFDPKSLNGDLTARWTGLTLKAGVRQGGQLTASLRQPFPGQPLIRVEVDDQGSIGDATATAGGKGGTKWDAAVAVTGQGTSWTSIDWVLGVPRLKLDSGEKSYDLSGITATVQQRPTTIDLLGLTLPPTTNGATGVTTNVAAAATGGNAAPASSDVRVTATTVKSAGSSNGPNAGGSPFGLTFASSAHVDLPDEAKGRKLNWTATASGGVLASYQGSPIPVTLAVDANGNDKVYTLKRFALSAADADVRADGTYDRSNPKPVALHVALTQSPRLNPNAPVQGTFNGDFKIVGLLFPLDPVTDAQPTTAATTAPATRPAAAPASLRVRPYLTTVGTLHTSELVLFGKPIGDIDIRLAGDVKTPHPPRTAGGPEAADDEVLPARVHVDLKSTEFALFQAPWTLSVEYPNDDGAAELNLSTRDLPLDTVVKAATGQQESPIAGQLASAHWRLTASGVGLGKVDLASEYHLTNLRAGSLTADTVDAQASFHDGVAKLDPVVAKHGSGRTDLSVTYALAAPTRVKTHVTVRDWPYPLTAALGGTTEARANADVDMGVDLRLKGAVGTVGASVDVVLHPPVGTRRADQTLAHAQLSADVRGRTLNLDELSGRVLNGTFSGSGQVDVGKPLEAAGNVKWQDVDAGALATITGNKALADLGGIFSGTVTVAPSRDPRTLEPVRIDVNVASRDGHYRTVKLGTPDRLLMAHAVAYANVNRAVLDHSDIFVAGGVVHAWGRVGADLGTQSVIVEYKGLSLQQLTHAVPEQVDGDVPGTLNGELRVIRNGSGLNAITGGGHADLVDADLVHVKAIGKLYDLLNKGGKNLEPVGRGGTDLSVEAGSVRVTGLRFLNRGVEVKGLLTVGPVDLGDLDNALLGGQVVGTLRDLKGSRIPFLNDFDKTFSVIQSGLSTLNVGGTLGKPKITPASADEIGTGLRELLVGDAQKQSSE